MGLALPLGWTHTRARTYQRLVVHGTEVLYVLRQAGGAVQGRHVGAELGQPPAGSG